ncbi:MAG: anti-sigma factor [Saprospiraceae bacterium]|nr:anti-sigma factor [Saprospiraceae bacterium]
MKEEIKAIIDSNLIENYILGLTSDEETRKVESLIQSSEEIRKVYDELQDTILEMTMQTSIAPPGSLKNIVLDSIPENREVNVRTLPFRYYAIAATLAAIVFAVFGFMQWSQKKQFEINNLVITEQLRELEILNDMNTTFIDSLNSQLAIINDPSTERYVLKGNDKSADFASIAYWNKDKKSAFLEVVNLPDPGEKKCFQMWYDIDGKMVSAGILPAGEESFSLKFDEKAESINITIEPEGGSDHPTVSNLIANVYI